MKGKLILIIGGAVLLAAVIAGCYAEITVTPVTGGVVNARSDALAGISGVEVTFTKADGGFTQTVTSSGSGTYSMSYTGAGQYKVTARKDGWFFIPQTVYVGGWLQKVPDILGIALDTAAWVKDTSISFILTWNTSYQDVDGFLTFPDGDGDGWEGFHSPDSSNAFTTPYSPIPAGTGFGPNTTSNRETITYKTPRSNNSVGAVLGESDSRPAIELDRDDRDGSGPEVITIRSLPFRPSVLEFFDYLLTGDDKNRLPTSHNSTSVTWTWIGVMEYYVDGWDANSSTTINRDNIDEDHYISGEDGSGADAVLHIVQGSRLLGAFRVPDYANIRTASLVRVNLFLGELAGTSPTQYVPYFQFVPDIQIVDYDGGMGIMSTGDDPQPIFGAFGRAIR